MRGAPNIRGAVARPRYRDIRADPICYLYAEHYTQLALCNLLEELLKLPHLPESREWAATISDYLACGFHLHAADEESDLTRAMRDNSTGNEEKILSRLIAMHQEDRDLAVRLRSHLETFASGKVPTDASGFVTTAYEFLERLREHLSWENRELLPLAWELPSWELRRLGQAISERHKRAVGARANDDPGGRGSRV